MKLACQLHAVAAMTQNRVIGRDGTMPWHVPDDLRFFKRLTTGHTILMGRKTWESLGRVLPHRRHLILSRSMPPTPGVEILPDLQALESLSLTGDVYVIGGAEIYRQLLPHCTSLYLTLLPFAAEGDTFFPEFADQFPHYEILESTPEAEWRRYFRSTSHQEPGK